LYAFQNFKIMKKILNFTFIIILFTFSVQAKVSVTEPEFLVEVSKTSVLLGNYIEVTFTLKNASGKNFEAPTFKGFDIMGGPNQSNSFSMMNGVTTQSMSFSYYIQPKDIGNLFLEPAFIVVDGKTLETQPIEIIVLENPDGIIEKPKRKGNHMEFFNFPNDDFFNSPMPDDFFNLPKRKTPKELEEEKKKMGKKKRKIYKI